MKNLFFVIFLFFSSFALGQCLMTLNPSTNSLNPNDLSVFKCPGEYVVMFIDFAVDDSPFEVTITKDGQPFYTNTLTAVNPQSPSFLIDSLFYAGDYLIQAVGASGQMCSEPILFTDPQPLSFDFSTQSPNSCVNDGAITITNIVGGQFPFDIGNINNMGIFDPVYTSNLTNDSYTIGSLLAGFYSFTFQDNLGCLTSFGLVDAIEIEQGVPEMMLSFSSSDYATICVQGGIAPYMFILNGDTVPSLTNCMNYSLCAGSYTVEVYDSYIDGLTCSKSIDFTIDNIVAEIDQDLASVVIASGGFEPFQYSWSVNGEVIEGENEAAFQGNFCPNSYECKITDQANCIEIVLLTIDELVVNLTEDVECSDQDFETLETNVSGGTSPYTYLWNTDETTETIGDLNPITYSVSINDVHSCSIMEQVDVPVVSDSCLFDAFSPNGDQTNDVWTINPSFLFDNSEVTIYNRWGAKVFESVGYSQPWDGTRKNGSKVAEGVYFYVIAFNNGVKNTKGSISVFY